MTSVLQVLFSGIAVHGVLTAVYAISLTSIYDSQMAIWGLWGSALGILPTFGFAFLSARTQDATVNKKGVALVVAGSVLRYGIFLLILALFVFTKIRVPWAFIGGLFLWVPASLAFAIFRYSEKRNNDAF